MPLLQSLAVLADADSGRNHHDLLLAALRGDYPRRADRLRDPLHLLVHRSRLDGALFWQRQPRSRTGSVAAASFPRPARQPVSADRMSMSGHSHGSAVRLTTEVHLARASDIDPVLSSWPQLLTLSSIKIGTGLLSEYERREHQAGIDARLGGCRCRESGLGMAAGAGLYAVVWALLPGLHAASAWVDLLVGLGLALLAGAVGRVVGHVFSRFQLRDELRVLQIIVAQDQSIRMESHS